MKNSEIPVSFTNILLAFRSRGFKTEKSVDFLGCLASHLSIHWYVLGNVDSYLWIGNLSSFEHRFGI